ncbi:DUF2079 domain-containing protein [Patescibacteria group bacterium]|nr:DUF2079 domain-containing protein [Patescibacteria group bacterium]MCL5409761.1 DUF2079 domain-containing protein [Patescibacteria group bacterium]
MKLTRFAKGSRASTLLILLGFIFFNLLLNSNIVTELLNNNPFRVYGGDGQLLEYLAEVTRLKIISGQNPFGYLSGLFYPLQASLNLQDIGFDNGFWFVIFSPFLTIHQSMSLLLLINFFLAEVFTYLLLRTLKVARPLAFIFALSFAFSPAFVFRIRGHFHYLYHFLYPLLIWLSLLIVEVKQRFKLVILSVCLGLSMSLLFFASGYLLVMFTLGLLSFGLLELMINRGSILSWSRQFGKKYRYFVFAGIIFLATLSPLIWATLHTHPPIENRPSLDYGGARAYAARPWDIFLPSTDNLFYGNFFQLDFPFHPHSIEGVIYPGILSFIGLVIFLFGKLDRRKYLSVFLSIIVFYILSWGPMIDLSKLSVPLLSNFIIPLPDIILAKLPILSMMRVPSRYGMPLVFVSVILAALVLNQKYQASQKFASICLGLFLVFLIDQSYQIPLEVFDMNLPVNSYQVIRQDHSNFAVMQIPFTLRDGFNYLGSESALDFHYGQLLTQKPFVGGYLSRVGLDKFDYYLQNPALHYFTSAIDVKHQHPYITDNQTVSQSLQHLSIKYILIQGSFSKLQAQMAQLGYHQLLSGDHGYNLYVLN